MGAVQIETYNQQLMNLANYEDKKSLKQLLKNYPNLEQLTGMGDTVAASIYVDLKVALFERPVLTPLQHQCVVGYFIEKSTLDELASDLGKERSTIYDHINGGVRRLQKNLVSGALYRKEGGGEST